MNEKFTVSESVSKRAETVMKSCRALRRILFEIPMKLHILSANESATPADSDPRLQFEVVGRAVVGEFESERVHGFVHEANQCFANRPLSVQQALRSG